MFEGIVLFTLNEHGWRVHFVKEKAALFTKVNLFKEVGLFGFKFVAITGHFTKKPRAGTYCKRPHKLIAQLY